MKWNFPFCPESLRLIHDKSDHLFLSPLLRRGPIVFLGIQGWQQGVLKPITGWIWLLWERSLGERLTSCWVRTSRNCYNKWQVPKLTRICEYLQYVHTTPLLAGIWSTLIPRLQGGDRTMNKRVGRISISAVYQCESTAPALTTPQRQLTRQALLGPRLTLDLQLLAHSSG